jgi:hypothetical protein
MAIANVLKKNCALDVQPRGSNNGAPVALAIVDDSGITTTLNNTTAVGWGSNGVATAIAKIPNKSIITSIAGTLASGETATVVRLALCEVLGYGDSGSLSISIQSYITNSITASLTGAPTALNSSLNQFTPTKLSVTDAAIQYGVLAIVGAAAGNSISTVCKTAVSVTYVVNTDNKTL